MTPAERKRAQRDRDRLLGWSEVSVRVAREHVEALRRFAASLPDPVPLTDPAQLSLLAALDAALVGDVSRSDNASSETRQGLLL